MYSPLPMSTVTFCRATAGSSASPGKVLETDSSLMSGISAATDGFLEGALRFHQATGGSRHNRTELGVRMLAMPCQHRRSRLEPRQRHPSCSVLARLRPREAAVRLPHGC